MASLVYVILFLFLNLVNTLPTEQQVFKGGDESKSLLEVRHEYVQLEVKLESLNSDYLPG
jgi:hypothetical protein